MPLPPCRRRARRLRHARAARRVHCEGIVHAVHLAHVGIASDWAGGPRLIVGHGEHRALSTSSQRSARVAAQRGTGKGVAPVPATSRSWSFTTRQSRPTSISKRGWRCLASSYAFVVHSRILSTPPRGAFRSAPRARRPRPPISMAPQYDHPRNPKVPHNYPRERATHAMHSHAHVKMRGTPRAPRRRVRSARA